MSGFAPSGDWEGGEGCPGLLILPVDWRSMTSRRRTRLISRRRVTRWVSRGEGGGGDGRGGWTAWARLCVAVGLRGSEVEMEIGLG